MSVSRARSESLVDRVPTARRTTLTRGWQDFQRRLERLRSLQGPPFEVDFDLEEKKPRALREPYKHREVQGCLLHYAIAEDAYLQEHDQSAPNTELVLRFGARPDALATYVAESEVAHFGAFHLASGLGIVRSMQLLFQYRADVDQKTLRGDRKHYTALHEACFMHKLGSVQCLLKLKADTEAVNLKWKTPLHIVAENGNTDIAECLVEAGARLDAEVPVQESEEKSTDSPARIARTISSIIDLSFIAWSPMHLPSEGVLEAAMARTPLGLAISGERRFPKDKLHVLAPFCREGYSSDLLTGMASVCRANMPAARSLVTSLRRECQKNPSRTIQVLQKVQEAADPINRLSDMLQHAPEVALDLLELLLLRPEATQPEYHALPVMANFAEQGHEWMFSMSRIQLRTLHTVYESANQWVYDAASLDNKFPRWHARLAPPPVGSLSDFEVDMRVLHFPNILDVRVIHAINHLQAGEQLLYEHFFSTTVVKAIVNGAWGYVRAAVYMNIAVDVAAVGILTVWALNDTDQVPSAEEKYRTWSVVGAVVLFEWINYFHLIFYHKLWKFRTRELICPTFVIDVVTTILLSIFLVVGRVPTNELNETLFCVNVLLRWFKLAHMLRLVSGVGDKILAVLRSLVPMGEFVIFAGLIYLAFLSAFASIRGTRSLRDISTFLFFSVFTAEGGAFIKLEDLDDHGTLTFWLLCAAILLFSVAILNLMIAVYGNVYASYEEKSACLFLQERCRVIEEYMLRWAWVRAGDSETMPSLSCWRLVPFFLFFVLFLVWIFALVAYKHVSAVALPVAAVFLAAGFVILQAGFIDGRFVNRDCLRQAKPAQRPAGDDNGRYDFLLPDDGPVEATMVTVDTGPSSDYEEVRAGAVDRTKENLFLWVCQRIESELAAHRVAHGSPREVHEEMRNLDAQLRSVIEKQESLGAKVQELAAHADYRRDMSAEIGQLSAIVKGLEKQLSTNDLRLSPI